MTQIGKRFAYGGVWKFLAILLLSPLAVWAQPQQGQFSFSGVQGGPFTPAAQTWFAVGVAPAVCAEFSELKGFLTYTITVQQAPWLAVSQTAGDYICDQPATIDLTVNSAASQLTPSTYTGTVTATFNFKSLTLPPGVPPIQLPSTQVVTAQVQLTVTPGNPPPPNQDAPKVTIDSPPRNATVAVNGTLNFAATATSQNPKAQLGFSWNFGAGANPASSTAEDPGSVRFTQVGINTVTLTVTDANNGLSTSTSVAVAVQEQTTGPTQGQIDQAFQNIAMTPPQAAVGATVATVCPKGLANNSASLQRDCDALVGAAVNNDPNASNALAQVTPDDASVAVNASQNSVAAQTRNIGARLAALRRGATGFSLAGLQFRIDDTVVSGAALASLLDAANGDGASADAAPGSGLGGRLGVFASGDVGFGSKDRTANVDGFDYDTWNITAGVDYRISDRFVVGGALGYIATDASIDNAGGKLDSDGYVATIFGSYYQADKFYIDGSVSFGRNSFDQKRNVRYTLGATAVDQTFSADYDGDQWALSLDAGYTIQHGALTITPTGRLQYLKAKVDGFRENQGSNPATVGSGWGLAIEDQEFKSLTTSLGGQMSYAISNTWGVLQPYANLEWIHEFEDSNEFVTGFFLGDRSQTRFRLATDDVDRNYFNLGVGLTALFTQSRSAFIGYQSVLGYKDLEHHTINAGFRLEF